MINAVDEGSSDMRCLNERPCLQSDASSLHVQQYSGHAAMVCKRFVQTQACVRERYFSLTLLMFAVRLSMTKTALRSRLDGNNKARNATDNATGLVVVDVSSNVLGWSPCTLIRDNTYTDHTGALDKHTRRAPAALTIAQP